MAGPEFFQTRMGQTFFEGTVPKLVRELEKLNKNLESMSKLTNPPTPPSRGDNPCGEVTVAGPEELKLRPTGYEPGARSNLMRALAREGQQSGESAGVTIGDHLMDMYDDHRKGSGDDELEHINLVIAELQNIEDWAGYIKKKLAETL